LRLQTLPDQITLLAGEKSHESLAWFLLRLRINRAAGYFDRSLDVSMWFLLAFFR